jgi:phage/plasmid-associated DNA primase
MPQSKKQHQHQSNKANQKTQREELSTNRTEEKTINKDHNQETYKETTNKQENILTKDHKRRDHEQKNRRITNCTTNNWELRERDHSSTECLADQDSDIHGDNQEVIHNRTYNI